MPRGRGGRGHGGRGGRGGGSGGRGGGGGEAGGREVTTSKAMSYLLRHGAEKEGVKIDEGGWVRVQDMVSYFLCLLPNYIFFRGFIFLRIISFGIFRARKGEDIRS